jgi:malate dehydrogenase
MHAVNWAILVGAMPRKAGMERSDLLATNGKIFTAQGKAINENAAGDVRVFVVGNPCNTNCLIAMHSAPNIPPENFYAMTMLDANRSRAQLAAKAGVEVRGVTHLAIWGNHSTTQYPDFYNARIEGCPVTDVITDTTWLENDFIKIVQQRGAAVIKARGASSAASAANAVIDSVFHLTHDTPTGEIFSVCKRSEGEYDVPAGLIYSFPCRTEGGKLRVVNDFTHNRFAQEKLRLTTEELQGEYRAVQGLGIIA